MEKTEKKPWELCYAGKRLSFGSLTGYLHHTEKCDECRLALEYNEVQQSIWRLDHYDQKELNDYHNKWRT